LKKLDFWRIEINGAGDITGGSWLVCLDDQLRVRQAMLMTKRKPATIGEILVEEFMKPIGLTQGALAEAMGVQRKYVNELCNDRRNVTAATALILARVFGNDADFWLNVQRRSDLWEAMHSPRQRKRIERARRLTDAA
jgi:addiction module HigA family antidote